MEGKDKDEGVITTLERYYKIIRAEIKILDKKLFQMTSEEYATKSGQKLREHTNSLFMAQLNLGLAIEHLRRAGLNGQITATAEKKEI